MESKKQPVPRRSMVLGIALGLAAGLLIDVALLA